MNAEQNTGMKSFVTHHMPKGPGDHLAYAFFKTLRFVADTFFAKRYGHRAVVLETVAAVPGMVGGLMQHLKCLRYIQHDNGWIRGCNVSGCAPLARSVIQANCDSIPDQRNTVDSLYHSVIGKPTY